MKQKESKSCNSDYAWQAQTQVRLWSIQHASNCRKRQQGCTAGLVVVEGDLQTGRREGRRIQRGFWCVRTNFSHMKKTGVTYRAYATN